MASLVFCRRALHRLYLAYPNNIVRAPTKTQRAQSAETATRSFITTCRNAVKFRDRVINFVETNKETDVKETPTSLQEYRFIYPEFLPNPFTNRRHDVTERLERRDMLKRRSAIFIPEFYVGSLLAVTVSDLNAPGKKSRFVGICIHRGEHGLRHFFILRNIIDNQGIEILYDMYNPTILSIDVLLLEKRLDESLFYLRDALPEYSTFPFDMEPVPHQEGNAIPINPIKVQLKPRPWIARWERADLKGVKPLGLDEKFYRRAAEVAKPWEKLDLMRDYRFTVPEEDQKVIYSDVQEYHENSLKQSRQVRRKRILKRPVKTA